MRGGTPGRGALIASPVFIGSIALLLLNDHVLKAAWPGVVTGKLSDVAGVAMIAIGLTALTRSRGLAFGITAVAFALLKTVPTVAVWAAPVLGGVTRTDPTDVLAVAVLIPLWRWVGQRAAQPRPALGAEWLLPVQIVAISCAVFATTATSCGSQGPWDVQAFDGAVFVRAAPDVFESLDGGSTWRRSEVEESDVRFKGAWAKTSCVGERCYSIVRSVEGLDSAQVFQEVDGERTALLGLTVEQRQEFRDLVEPVCEDESLGAIAALRLDDGDHVVLAMGEAGVLHRPPDGAWEWAGVGPWGFDGGEADGEPLGFRVASTADVPFLDRNGWIGAVMLLAVPAGLAACVIPIRRLGARRGRDPVAAQLLCALAAAILGFFAVVVIALTSGFGNESGRVPAALVFALIAAAIAALLLLVQLRRGPAERPLAPPRPDSRVG